MALLKVGTIIFDDKAVIGLRWQEEGLLKLDLSGGIEYTLQGEEAQKIWSRFEQQSQDLMVEHLGSGFAISTVEYS